MKTSRTSSLSSFTPQRVISQCHLIQFILNFLKISPSRWLDRSSKRKLLGVMLALVAKPTLNKRSKGSHPQKRFLQAPPEDPQIESLRIQRDRSQHNHQSNPLPKFHHEILHPIHIADIPRQQHQYPRHPRVDHKDNRRKIICLEATSMGNHLYVHWDHQIELEFQIKTVC